MRKPTAKEIFSIPNCMGYLRILLIPVFVCLYFTAKTDIQYYAAVAVVLVSSITDCLDGQVARRCNMITELGKFIDPLADKLTHGALVICLCSRYPLMFWLLGLLVVKEGFMAVMGAYKLRTCGKKLDGAKWFGKVCTALLFVVMLLLLVWRNIPLELANGLIYATMAVMVATILLYIPVFARMK